MSENKPPEEDQAVNLLQKQTEELERRAMLRKQLTQPKKTPTEKKEPWSLNKKPRFKDIKPVAPPLGNYKPKLISKSQKILRRYGREANKTIPKERPPNPLLEGLDLRVYDLEFNPDKLRSKIRGFKSMNRMLNRKPEQKKDIVDPEGKRFLYRDIPRVSSRYRPVSGFSMKKGRPDSRSTMFTGGEDQPDYQPNYEYGKKRTWCGVPIFELTTGRKPAEKESITPNEQFFDYEGYKKSNSSHFYKRVPGPSFKKMQPRKFIRPSHNTHLFKKLGDDNLRPSTAVKKTEDKETQSAVRINKQRPFSSNTANKPRFFK